MNDSSSLLRPSRRGFLGLVAAGGSAGLLAACGGGSSGAGSSPKKLQFFLSGDANQGGGYAHMAAKYKQATGIEVQIVDIAYADLPTKLTNAAQANDMPALARAGGVDPVWKDITVDLSPVTEATKVDMDLATVDHDGKVMAIPSDITAVGMFVNKTLYDKAGVSYPGMGDQPWTWDEFVAGAKEVQQKAGAKYGLVMDRSSHRLKAFVYEFGSTWFQPNAAGTFSTNAATKTALEYFAKLNDDTFMPRSVWLSDGDPNALFKSGDVAAYMSGSWQIADFAQNIKAFAWQSVLLPKQPVRATNYGNAASISVFQGTGQEDAAIAFLKWLYSPENYTELAQTSGFLPAVKGLDITYKTDSDAFALYNAEIAKCAPIAGKIKQMELQYEVAGKATEGDPARDETVKYLNGEQDVDTTIANICSQLSNQLGKLL